MGMPVVVVVGMGMTMPVIVIVVVGMAMPMVVGVIMGVAVAVGMAVGVVAVNMMGAGAGATAGLAHGKILGGKRSGGDAPSFGPAAKGARGRASQPYSEAVDADHKNIGENRRRRLSPRVFRAICRRPETPRPPGSAWR